MLRYASILIGTGTQLGINHIRSIRLTITTSYHFYVVRKRVEGDHKSICKCMTIVGRMFTPLWCSWPTSRQILFWRQSISSRKPGYRTRNYSCLLQFSHSPGLPSKVWIQVGSRPRGALTLLTSLSLVANYSPTALDTKSMDEEPGQWCAHHKTREGCWRKFSLRNLPQWISNRLQETLAVGTWDHGKVEEENARSESCPNAQYRKNLFLLFPHLWFTVVCFLPQFPHHHMLHQNQ